MLRWLRSWTEPLLAWAALAALGLVAEWRLYGWSTPSLWLPDLVTGWCLAGCGLVVWRRHNPGQGALLAAAGMAWFVPNLTPHLLYLHRGPLVQAAVAYPRGRPRRGWELAVVGAGWVFALTTVVWGSATLTLAVSPLLALVAWVSFISSAGPERRERAYGLRAMVVLAATLLSTAALHLAVRTSAGTRVALHVYEAGLIALALILLWGLLRLPWRQLLVTDLVVELGERRGGSLRDALARAVGDPTLEVGYWLSGAKRFVDARGQPLDLPTDSETRSVTFVERDGEPAAALVHDRAVLDDPILVEAVAAATGLAGANARLQAELQERVNEVRVSRRRLLAAGDEERRRLERRLRQGAQQQLEKLAGTLRDARASAGSARVAERIAKAEEQAARTLEELSGLAQGIHPRALTDQGVAGALSSLVADFPLPVRLEAAPLHSSGVVDACIYFVCAEALSNIAKYAEASHVTISLEAGEEAVSLQIEDDGAGGATLDGGTGLGGLAERVETLGGTFSLDSPPGGGTRLRVVLPASD